MAIEDRIRRLEDMEAIKLLTARYAEINDTGKDPDAMVALFATNGIWENPAYGIFVGREEMRSYWKEQGEATSFSLHYLTNHIIDINESGTEAGGRWYQFGTFIQGSQAYWVGIWYSAEFRKIEGEWFFSSMKLARQFMTPFEMSWVKPLTN
jgi:hypothetical protein